MRLGCLPDLPEIIVEHAEARYDQAVGLALFPRKLSQGFGIVGAVGQRHGFKIKATRGVWAPGLGLVRQKQMLSAAADRIDRSDFLRGELLLCILLLVQEGAEGVGGRHER